jgi:hypothetical protein
MKICYAILFDAAFLEGRAFELFASVDAHLWLGVVGFCGETINCRTFILCVCDRIQNLQNCLTTQRQKPKRGGGLRQIYGYRKVPFHVNFLDDNISQCLL